MRRPFQKLETPEYYGVNNAINIRIPVEEGESIGAWCIRPDQDGRVRSDDRWKAITSNPNFERINSFNQSPLNCDNSTLDAKVPSCDDVDHQRFDEVREYLSDPDEIVILYLHGTAETRSLGHRRELYKKLQELGIVVLAPDYRGYADSYGGFSFRTSESSMSWDGAMSLRFAKKHIHPKSKVIVWGHSLGTGVTSKLANDVLQEKWRPDAYVLEAPFNKMVDEVESFAIAKPFKYLINIQTIIENIDLAFDNETLIKNIKEPIFIMHAEDDGIIPFRLGKRLFDVAETNSCNARFFPFEKCLHLGHDNIYSADQFQEVVKVIINTVKE